MAKVEHIIKSYQIDTGEWVPFVKEMTYYGDRITDESFTWDKKFSTKKEADAFVQSKLTEAKRKEKFED